jgi:hypothetical protein
MHTCNPVTYIPSMCDVNVTLATLSSLVNHVDTAGFTCHGHLDNPTYFCICRVEIAFADGDTVLKPHKTAILGNDTRLIRGTENW